MWLVNIFMNELTIALFNIFLRDMYIFISNLVKTCFSKTT